MRKRSAGFTLIELLIVISLLGALAVGLIGAIDPFEQLKKGTDTGTRDLVNQVQTAVIRYFSIKNNMPWCPDGGTPGTPASCLADPDQTALNVVPMDTSIDNMVASGELKSEFETIHSGNLGRIFVTGSQANNTVIVCYMPTSKSFQADPNTKFDAAGVEQASGCKSQTGGTNDCYWCIQ
jgi:prepilin-type N-terminal cleavage/methylation domain-containing protein